MMFKLLPIWLGAALLLTGFYAVVSNADDSGIRPPVQWQYHESLDVPPGPIPRTRCLRAIYLDDDLKRERGFDYWEQWQPPITPPMAAWLEQYREQGKLALMFCDSVDA